MNKINIVRLAFCGLPAIIFAVVIRLANAGPFVVGFTLVATFLLLWLLTSPHPEDLGLQPMTTRSPHDGPYSSGLKQEDIPIDPKTGLPYFTISKDGWGAGWEVGEVQPFHLDADKAQYYRLGDGVKLGDTNDKPA